MTVRSMKARLKLQSGIYIISLFDVCHINDFASTIYVTRAENYISRSTVNVRPYPTCYSVIIDAYAILKEYVLHGFGLLEFPGL